MQETVENVGFPRAHVCNSSFFPSIFYIGLLNLIRNPIGRGLLIWATHHALATSQSDSISGPRLSLPSSPTFPENSHKITWNPPADFCRYECGWGLGFHDMSSNWCNTSCRNGWSRNRQQMVERVCGIVRPLACCVGILKYQSVGIMVSLLKRKAQGCV